MNYPEFINLVSFCLLMENNAGILEKSPGYVLEQFENRYSRLLGYSNNIKLRKYINKWKILLKDIEGYPND